MLAGVADVAVVHSKKAIVSIALVYLTTFTDARIHLHNIN